MNDTKKSPLMHAIEWGNPKKVRELIDQGADVTQRTDRDWSLLMKAAASNSEPYITDILIEEGTPVHATSEEGANALSVASFHHSLNPKPKLIKRLLEEGADVNLRDSLGHNALMTALCTHEDPEIIKEFLEAGGDLMLESNDGYKAYEWIEYNTVLKTNYSRFYNKIRNWDD